MGCSASISNEIIKREEISAIVPLKKKIKEKKRENSYKTPQNEEILNKIEKIHEDKKEEIPINKHKKVRLFETTDKINNQNHIEKIDDLKYKRLNLIGQGSSGKVYLGQLIMSSKIIAIKTIALEGDILYIKEKISQIKNEIEINHLLIHENVIKYYGLETRIESKGKN